MALTPNGISKLIDEISIAALRSWLKSQGFEHSANTREQMVQRLDKLLKKEDISEDELLSGISNIEEASSKRIFLVGAKERKHLETEGDFAKYLHSIGKSISKKQLVAPRLPSKSTLVYIAYSPKQIRAKWAETQTRVEADYVTEEFIEKKVTKIVALVTDIETGLVQVRYDKPEMKHQHKNSKEEYFAYYKQLAAEVLGTELTQFETREALRSLVETEPRVVRIRVNEHRSKTDKSVRYTARIAKSDVRDDPEWQAATQAGGQSRAYDDQAVYWLPDPSKGALTREVFTDIDAVNSIVRVEADCHEGEIQYAVSKVREHQIKASKPS